MPDMGVVACGEGEWLRYAGCRLFLVFVDFDAVGEGLVCEALPLRVGGLVEMLAVHEEPQGAGDLLARALVLVVFRGEAAVDVGQAGTDAVLVALEGVEVDGVGEVRGEDLVGLGFQPPPVRSWFREFVGAGSEAFIEGGLNRDCTVNGVTPIKGEPRSRSTFTVKNTGVYPRVHADTADVPAIGHAGGVLLTETIRATGLDRALSEALGSWRKPLATHDPGKVILDLAVTLALGGDALSDIATVRAEPGV
jgi:hypothetical protein